jgi:hypothetical protein
MLMATLPLVGVALGAILQHWLSRNAEDRKQLLALRREAYVDYLRATTKIARAKDSDSAWNARTALADAKARIAIYGTTSVLHAMSTFEATVAAIRGDEGRRAFVLLTAARRTASGRRIGRPAGPLAPAAERLYRWVDWSRTEPHA